MNTFCDIKNPLQKEGLLILDLELNLMYLKNGSGRGLYNPLYNAFTRVKEKKGGINKTNINSSVKNQ
ncbi:MAG TPA: hypothetical protein VJH20_03110 [Candidatus Nanoarchaeia archaeon]|nr:hypothetical protein [Candidatus Nanoarchaeia archaeon]